MAYEVLKDFKCRFQKYVIFKEGKKYNSVNEKHTKRLIQLGFIKKVDQMVEKDEEIIQKPKRTRKSIKVDGLDE